MPAFVVTARFEVTDRPGDDDPCRGGPAGGWGAGHLFSCLDGGVLTLVVEMSAVSAAAARAAVLTRAGELLATGPARRPLRPLSLTVEEVGPPLLVVPGVVGRGPDGLLAESAARATAGLRATREALAGLLAAPDGP